MDIGLVAPWHMVFSWTRDRTCVPCIGRKILNHWESGKIMALLLNEAVCSTGLLNIDSQQKIPDTKAVMTCFYFVLLLGEFVASISILFGDFTLISPVFITI